GRGRRKERNFSRDWIKHTQIPMYENQHVVFDVVTHEVQPRPEIEGRGMYLNCTGNVHMHGVIFEIPPGKALAPRKTFFEQVFIGLRGNGYTLFGEDPHKNKVEWGEGSLFAGPLNVMHRHYNGSSKPARLLAITSFPFMLQVFGNLGLVNNLNFQFMDRYISAHDYFSKTVHSGKRTDITNYVK